MSIRVITADDGVRLHTRSDGPSDAPVLLLLNSLGADLSMWDPQIATWSEEHRLIRFDQRGHGRSDAPTSPYSVERFGRDALAVLDAYGTGTADVCGLSLGGLVALWLAGSAPERVRRVVLADTAARIGTEQGWRERAATVREGGMDAVTDLVLGRFFSPTFRASGASAVAALDRTLRTIAVDGYAGSCDALADADLTDLAHQVRVPSLVIVGTADEATPPVDAQVLHDLLARSELVELAGAGHLANLEQPERFGRVVLDFLSQATEPAAPGPGDALDRSAGRDVGEDRATAGALIANRSTPLVVVSAYDGRARAGCLVSFHTHVSIRPHRYLVCLAGPNHTSRVAEGANHLAVHFLTQRHVQLARYFGGMTGDEIDKFDAHRWQPWDDGTPLLDEVTDRIVGRIRSRAPFGDHVGYLLDVTVSSVPAAEPPLTLDELGPIEPGHPL